MEPKVKDPRPCCDLAGRVPANHDDDPWGGQVHTLVSDTRHRDYAHRRLIDELKLDFTDMAVLDVGCGSGDLVHFAQTKGAVAAGVDSSKEIARYHAQSTDLTIVRGDVCHLPMLDHSFGLTTCHGLVEHVDDPVDALRELRRVTRVGGLAIISVPNVYSVFPVLAPVWFLGCGRYRSGWRQMIGRVYSNTSFRDSLKSAGWTIEQIAPFKIGTFLDLAGLPFWQPLAEGAESSRLLARFFGIMLYARCRNGAPS